MVFYRVRVFDQPDGPRPPCSPRPPCPPGPLTPPSVPVRFSMPPKPPVPSPMVKGDCRSSSKTGFPGIRVKYLEVSDKSRSPRPCGRAAADAIPIRYLEIRPPQCASKQPVETAAARRVSTDKGGGDTINANNKGKSGKEAKQTNTTAGIVQEAKIVDGGTGGAKDEKLGVTDERVEVRDDKIETRDGKTKEDEHEGEKARDSQDDKVDVENKVVDKAEMTTKFPTQNKDGSESGKRPSGPTGNKSIKDEKSKINVEVKKQDIHVEKVVHSSRSDSGRNSHKVSSHKSLKNMDREVGEKAVAEVKANAGTADKIIVHKAEGKSSDKGRKVTSKSSGKSVRATEQGQAEQVKIDLEKSDAGQIEVEKGMKEDVKATVEEDKSHHGSHKGSHSHHGSHHGSRHGSHHDSHHGSHHGSRHGSHHGSHHGPAGDGHYRQEQQGHQVTNTALSQLPDPHAPPPDIPIDAPGPYTTGPIMAQQALAPDVPVGVPAVPVPIPMPMAQPPMPPQPPRSQAGSISSGYYSGQYTYGSGSAGRRDSHHSEALIKSVQKAKSARSGKSAAGTVAVVKDSEDNAQEIAVVAASGDGNSHKPAQKAKSVKSDKSAAGTVTVVKDSDNKAHGIAIVAASRDGDSHKSAQKARSAKSGKSVAGTVAVIKDADNEAQGIAVVAASGDGDSHKSGQKAMSARSGKSVAGTVAVVKDLDDKAQGIAVVAARGDEISHKSAAADHSRVSNKGAGEIKNNPSRLLRYVAGMRV